MRWVALGFIRLSEPSVRRVRDVSDPKQTGQPRGPRVASGSVPSDVEVKA